MDSWKLAGTWGWNVLELECSRLYGFSDTLFNPLMRLIFISVFEFKVLDVGQASPAQC